MADQLLLTYIRERAQAGMPREEIVRELLAKNWSPSEVTTALIEAGMPLGATPSAPPAPNSGASHHEARPPSPLKTTLLNGSAGLFIACVIILTGISILGVWDIFGRDVITKSFETLGLLALVAIIVVIAGKFMGDPAEGEAQPVPNPVFHAVRNITLVILIASAALLAFLGVLAIWDVITDKDVLGKSLSSLAILTFSSFIIVMVALEREESPLWQRRHREISGGAVLAFVILLWILFTFSHWF